MKARLDKLRNFMMRQNLDAIVVCKPENRYYFSGFTGSSGALAITYDEAALITDFRYVEQAQEQAACFDVVEHGASLLEKVAEVLQKSVVGKIGFEGDFFTYNEFSIFTQRLKGEKLKAVGLDSLRMVKDSAEIALMKKAVAISDAAFSHILNFIVPGVDEIAIAAELEHEMRKLGSEKPAFDTIVASGERGSLPHGTATDKIVRAGEFVTMDFGAVYKGYHSDITRTICVGKASAKQRELYDVVYQAQLLGVKLIQAGCSGREVDAEVRRYIANAGFGKYFGHGLGHGVGLAIHEMPRLSPSSDCEALEENMIVTVEPGIYLPGFGGVRIEDTVLVAAHGAEVLTKSGKQLIEI